MNEIYKLNNQMTILVVAHRLSTVHKCDEIFLLDKGEILGSGNMMNLKRKVNFLEKRSILN